MREKQQDPTQPHSVGVTLRKRAEEQADTMEQVSLSAYSPEKIQGILHELQVHQIELEMQNEELRESQERIEAGRARYFDLYDLAPVGYCTINEKGIILESNLTLTAMLNADRQTVIRKPFSAFILREDQDIYYLIRKKLFDTDLPQTCEFRMLRGDNATFWASMQATALQDEDGTKCLRVTVSDCSQQKIAEQQLRKSEEKLQDFAKQLEKKNRELDMALYKTEAVNEAKTKFLATMNHEIRTPLNGMLGFLQLLEETPISDVQSEYMNYMNYSAHHLLSLVNNVLDMVKIEAGEMQLDKRSFHLAEEIDTALASLYPLAREKGLQLQVLKDSHLPDRLEGDPLRLRQIFLNLVGNALKFTEEGSVCVTIESLGSIGGFHNLHLEVRDTGPGMDQDSQDKLFQPFFQIRDNHAAHPGGTGLGLPITRELVELMDGKIQVHSVLGAGSTFTVRLSLKEIKEVPQSHLPLKTRF